MFPTVGLSPEQLPDRLIFVMLSGFALPADDISEDSSRVFVDGANRWLVRDTRLAQMSLNTDWEYYGAVDRFLKVTCLPSVHPSKTWSMTWIEYLKLNLDFLSCVRQIPLYSSMGWLFSGLVCSRVVFFAVGPRTTDYSLVGSKVHSLPWETQCTAAGKCF